MGTTKFIKENKKNKFFVQYGEQNIVIYNVLDYALDVTAQIVMGYG